MRRQRFPMCEIASNPTISLDEIKTRRFTIMPAPPKPLEDKLRELLAIIDEEFPEIGDILHEAKQAGTSEEDTMELLIQLMQDNPEMATELTRVATELMAPLRAEGELLKPKTATGPGLLFDSGVGMPRMNPLYEAALIERLQFDEDIPEARTGPLTPGVKPAVPVDTDARDPAALGHMLQTASDQVDAKALEHRQALLDHVSKVATELEETGTNLVVLQERGTDLAVMARGSAATDPAVYRRGQVPAPLAVAEPTGKELANLTPEKRQELTWKFLSTTQGRRSACKTIWEGIAQRLRSVGLLVADYEPPPAVPQTDGVRAYADWTYSLSGPKSTQSSFAIVDTAIAVMAVKLIPQVTDLQPELRLEVLCINTVDIREVGWAARLLV